MGEKEKEDEDIDDLLDEAARKHTRSDYRKSLGKEHTRRNKDREIRELFRKDEEDD